MVLETHSLQVRWALVVGGNSAVGRSLAVKLLKQGWHVLIQTRGDVATTSAKKQLAQEAKYQISGKANPFEVQDLDLGDLRVVRDFAHGIIRRKLRLQLLVFCAGDTALEKEETTNDGLEVAFASNFVAPFLLSCLLAPTLTRCQPSAVFHVVSNGCIAAKKMEVNMDLVRQQLAMVQDTDGMLKVHLVKATNLSTDFGVNGTCNPFIRVTVGEEQRVTTTKMKANPGLIHFNEHFQVRTKAIEGPIRFEIFHQDKKLGDRSMGTFSIGLESFAADPVNATYTMGGDFQLEKASAPTLNAEKELLEQRLARREIHRSTRAMYTENNVGQYAEAAKELGVQLVDIDKQANVIRFTVIKRLNFLFQGKRFINVDLKNKIVRNTTKQGEERKQFPFRQLLSMVMDAEKHQRLVLTFIHDSIRDEEGNFLAYGGQRDYELQFYSREQRDLFVEVMKHHISSTPHRSGSKVSYNVVKRFNALRQGLRQLVIDEEAKTLSNHEKVFAPGEGPSEQETHRKTIHFWQLLHFVEDEKRHNNLRIKFTGGQQDYKIEFLTPEQKDHFIRLMLPHLPLRIGGSVQLSMQFQGHTYGRKVDHYAHRLQARTADLPDDLLYTKTLPGQQGTPLLSGAEWMSLTSLALPHQPSWFKSLGHPYKGEFSRKQLNLHANLCLLASAAELAARVHEQGAGPRCFTVDPGAFPASAAAFQTSDGWEYHDPTALFDSHIVADELLKLLPTLEEPSASAFLQLSKSFTGAMTVKHEPIERPSPAGAPGEGKPSKRMLAPRIDSRVVKTLWHETSKALLCDVDATNPRRGEMLAKLEV